MLRKLRVKIPSGQGQVITLVSDQWGIDCPILNIDLSLGDAWSGKGFTKETSGSGLSI